MAMEQKQFHCNSLEQSIEQCMQPLIQPIMVAVPSEPIILNFDFSFMSVIAS